MQHQCEQTRRLRVTQGWSVVFQTEFFIFGSIGGRQHWKSVIFRVTTIKGIVIREQTIVVREIGFQHLIRITYGSILRFRRWRRWENYGFWCVYTDAPVLVRMSQQGRVIFNGVGWSSNIDSWNLKHKRQTSD
jgi:hypothetical protein